ncbi:hypothetical protein FKW77_002147 [Venturia effusa]|uniref:DUF155 domain-containing protein n=1 Tax=Venturia effusa TaxID=50376 RepID=A0A517LGN2_9PEZI|nr:hypothetical protein FKW77_002147 [Venturia effusa]
MASTESTPLIPKPSLQSQANPPTRPQRTVTFNPTVQSSSSTAVAGPRQPSINQRSTAQSGQPVLASLNDKLRRRHSQGAAGALIPALPAQKIGPQRTTKTAQKLKILPDPEHGDDGPDEESGRDVYAQFTRIKDPTARRDAARLGKEDRKRLPRVTAYCTAGGYRMEELQRYLKGKLRLRGAAPKLFDECIYTPYHYTNTDPNPEHNKRRPGSFSEPSTINQRRFSDSAVEVESHNEQRREDMIDMHTSGGDLSLDIGDGPLLVPNHAMPIEEDVYSRSMPDTLDFDTEVHTPEVFLFSYGTLVIWGMTLQQELRFLKEIAKFEVEKLDKDDVQTEDFNFYYTREYQARIYNDFISLRDKKNYMTKLAISHALAQSVKTSLYEDLVDGTIETTKEIPAQIATTGKVNLTRQQINMQIGELFILRINIHLQGSVLDAPELMWAEPQLDPIYQAVRSYLEMDQRVGLLTERLDVIADLLAVLKDQLSHTHGEYLEWIVIVLIAAEIVVAAVNILVDLWAGVD